MSDTVKKNLGGVTAYAYAKSKGYTGTEDEFAQLMANYATVGQAAEEAAEQAVNAEINAESAAQTATTKASEASSSATSASGSASAAATSETNAAASATEASGSATQAATSATAAQAAQTAAERVAESIPEDYSELSADVDDVKNALDSDLSFVWIQGGWINYSTGALVASETYYYCDYIPVYNLQSIRTYTNLAGNAGIVFYDASRRYISGYQATTAGLLERIITVPPKAAYVRMSCHIGSVSVEGTNIISYYGISPQLNLASQDIRDIKNIIGDGVYTPFAAKIELGMYNNGGQLIVDSGLHILIEVREGEQYQITGNQLSSWFPLGQLYNNGTRVGTIDAGTTGTVRDYAVTIPSGVNQLIINGIDYQLLSVKKLVSNYYSPQLYDWYVVDAPALDNVIANNGSAITEGHHLQIDVIEGEHYKISGARWSDYVPSWVIGNGTSIVSYETGRTEQYFTDLEITIPHGGTILYINGNAATGLKCVRYGRIDYARKTKTLAGKTMVWFGTSIPQNTQYFDGANWSIPSYAGKILGMNVINECYGASIAARGIFNQITENDSYGWTGVSWYAVFRSLGSNLQEKQDLIDNYESKWYALLGGSTDPLYANAKPQTLTDALKAEILSCSYENRLVPYLNGTKPMPDLFVFEHGYNDSQATVFSGISPDETNLNRSRYSDAMYFFFKLIWEANPQAKIMVVSHYDNSSEVGKKTFAAQKELAEYHGVYFCDVANNVGWTQRLVTTSGYWDNGNWIASGGTERTITRLAMCIPDQVHPHTDKSGNAVKREAQVIADYIGSSVNLD